MKLAPILTEKSMKLAENGVYTFWVDKRLNKNQIRELVDKTFDVNVTNIRTLNVAGETKKTVQGYKRVVQSRKKAMVRLSDKESIDLFEVKGKK